MSDIFEATSDGLWVWDGQGCLIAINEQAEKIGGVKEDALIGKNYRELISQGLYDRSAVPDIIASRDRVVVQAKSLRTGIVTINTGAPRLDEQGNIVRVVVKERNVTMLGQGHDPEAIQRMFDDDAPQLGLIRLEREDLVAESENYRQVLKTSLKLAESGVSAILILGDSGTGKGLLAKVIHQMSDRRDEPFVQINCAAVPEDLLEAELFGYEPGAFTGARKEGKAGLFELAEGGTLFLDEIGDLPPNLQAKLLKYLDDFQIRRLGGTEVKTVRCTVVAATNRDLEALVRQNRFREDLLFRINAFTLTVPPLRERPEDLRGLVTHSLERYNRTYGKNRSVSPLLLERLQAYPFPGNVRELKNVIKRAVVLSETDRLDETILDIVNCAPVEQSGRSLRERILNYERRILIDAVSRHTSTRAIGDYLGIDQSNVVRKLKKHGLSLRSK